MKRKKVLICASLICTVYILTGCGQMVIDDELERVAVSENTEDVYRTFDWDSVQADLSQIPETEMDFVELNENVNAGAMYAEYQGNFPEELVEEFETLLIQKNKKGMDYSFDDSTDYDELLKKYGSENYELTLDELAVLFPEVEEHREEIETVYDAYQFCGGSKNCYNIFRFFSEENREFYLYVYGYGGTAGYCYAELMEKIEDEMILTGVEFDMQNEGGGKLICYEGDYYFVFMQSNYRLKYGDGIRIYRVGPDATEADNVLIRCVPAKFVWEDDVMASDDAIELSAYIDQIKEEIVDTRYIETGDTQGAWYSYGMEGNGEMASDFPLNTEKESYRKLDFANMNVPIYYKTNVSQVEKFPPQLEGEFYLYDGKKILELSKLSQRICYYDELVQMWFYEIDDKVYTFQIFRLRGYNYMLAVRFVEGNEVTTIRCDHIVPRFCFEITEGEEKHVGC